VSHSDASSRHIADPVGVELKVISPGHGSAYRRRWLRDQSRLRSRCTLMHARKTFHDAHEFRLKLRAKSACLSIDPRTVREFFHTVGDNRSQLHHLLAQFNVFRNVALNAIAVGL
jgi:hypothetical protein